MDRIVILNEELESQMRIYLALCDRYRVEVAEDEPALMRMIRRKNPQLIFLDAALSAYKNNGKSICKAVSKIRRKYNHLKIITVLDPEQEAIQKKLQDIGSDHILFRPLSETGVVQSVSTLLNRHTPAYS